MIQPFARGSTSKVPEFILPDAEIEQRFRGASSSTALAFVADAANKPLGQNQVHCGSHQERLPLPC